MNRLKVRASRLARSAGFLLFLLGAAAAYTDFLKALAQRESTNNPTAVNSGGFAGLFQMSEAAMIDAGFYRADGTKANDWKGAWTGASSVATLSSFLSNPQTQVNAVTAYHAALQTYIAKLGLNNYVGSTIGGVAITPSGLVAGAHLVGIGGLQQWLQSGGATVPRDGNGVPISSYVQQFGGYALSTTAPTYWGTGSTGPTPPSNANSPVVGGVKPYPYQSPSGAFGSVTGSNMGQLRLMVATVFVAVLFLWVCWTTLCSAHAWSKGRVTLKVMGRDLAGAVLMTTIFVWFVN